MCLYFSSKPEDRSKSFHDSEKKKRFAGAQRTKFGYAQILGGAAAGSFLLHETWLRGGTFTLLHRFYGPQSRAAALHELFMEITSLSMGSPNTKAALSLLATGALCLLRPATSFLPATHPAGQMSNVMYSNTEATATYSPTHALVLASLQNRVTVDD